jgi:hypothetical protein
MGEEGENALAFTGRPRHLRSCHLRRCSSMLAAAATGMNGGSESCSAPLQGAGSGCGGGGGCRVNPRAWKKAKRRKGEWIGCGVRGQVWGRGGVRACERCCGPLF